MIYDIGLMNFATEVLQSEKPVLLDFFAEWCAPCKILSSELESFSKEHEEYKVCRLDVDKTTELATMYGIMSVPTLLLFKGGKETSRLVGAQVKDAIEKFCEVNN